MAKVLSVVCAVVVFGILWMQYLHGKAWHPRVFGYSLDEWTIAIVIAGVALGVYGFRKELKAIGILA